MKHDIKILFLFAAALLAWDAAMAGTPLRKALEQDKYLAAGNFHPYIPPGTIYDTPAPKGFKPFYFSFYGRHGCRYYSGSDLSIAEYISKMDKLCREGALTAEGERLCKWLDWSYGQQKDRLGDLTERGFNESKDMGRRYADRYSRIFRQKGRDSLRFRGSPILRSTVTGIGFISELGKKYPHLILDARSGRRYYFTEWSANPIIENLQNEVPDSIFRSRMDSSGFCSRIFKNGRIAKETFREKGILSAVRKLMFFLGITPCFAPDADPFSCFTLDELEAFAVAQNASTAATFIHSRETGDFRDRDTGAPLLRNIIEWADDAIAGNHICADLRFGHDSGVAPVLSLLHAEGYDKTVPLSESHISWPAWEHLYMGSHFALVFYRNAKGEVLVKLLENERETRIPLLSPYSGPYYRWADFRDYCIRRI